MGVMAGLRRAIAALTLLACVMVLAVLGLAVYSAIRANAAAVERSTRLDPATAATAGLLTQIVDQKSSLGAYLFTADYQELGPYYRAEWEVPARLEELERLLADFDGPAGALHEVDRAYQTWVTAVVEPELEAKARGDNERVWEVEQNARAGVLFDDVRGLLVILDARIADEQKQAFERVEASSRLLLSSLAASVLVIVFMVASIVVGLRQWLLTPIDALRRAVNAVAAGRYDTRIPAVGPKEIVALANNIEAMRALLVQLVRQNERSWEALAQQGPAVVALRDALTPSTLHASGVVLLGRVDPAVGELAGDWFDSFDLPDGRVAVVVGDVSGHGATAGVFALRLKQLLGAALNGGAQPGEAIEWAVDSLGETDEMFATAVVAVVDPRTGTLHFANAGHPEPLLLHRGGPRIPSQPPDGDGSRAAAGVLVTGRESSVSGPSARPGGVHAAPVVSPAASPAAAVETLGITGPLVSSLLAAPGAWSTETVHLWPGDVFFAYTDGLVEARDVLGEQFGQSRLVEEILGNPGRRPGDLLDGAFDAVRRHSPGRPGDDRTAIVLARTAPAQSAELRVDAFG